MQTTLPDIKQVVRILSKPWKKNFMPRRILAIRLQAMGDLVITLPYLQHLKRSLPLGSELDLLTRNEVDVIPKNIQLFDHVYSISGGRNVKKQLLYSCLLLPKLLLKRYNVVIDLQNNEVSRLILRTLRPAAWSSFDRFSPVTAGERTRMTIEAVGLGQNALSSGFHFKEHIDSLTILKKNGWDGKSKLVVLNPAGAFLTRNWPLENYIAFAELWLHRSPQSQFLVLGTSFIESKVTYLKERLGGRMISIMNKTTAAEAFAILQHVKFMLSEDSGLMHMAWVSGVPTIALFGSTRSDWSRPLGEHSFFLDSSDLPCGNCMQEICRYADNHCLTRYTAEFVFERAVRLIEQVAEQG